MDSALKLFNERGFHATGIEAVLEDAGVAKMTLYAAFGSKGDLVLAVLDRLSEQWLGRLEAAAAGSRGGPQGRLLAVFDVLGEWVRERGFSGCLFGKAAAEFPEARDPIHEKAAAHKARVLDWVEALARDAGAKDSASLAMKLCVLVEGAASLSLISGSDTPAREARQAAEALINAALAPGARPRRRTRRPG